MKLHEVLAGKEDNYILPFFWLRGEDEALLREEMERIYESGIRAVCLEARPHPDFLGPKWWQDVEAIMDVARERGMKIWILDDDHFPTGRAAGKLIGAPRELRRSFLSEHHIDALGPAPQASFLLDKPMVFGGTSDDRLVAVVACKRDSRTGVLTGESVDLTAFASEGVVHWSVPEGYWRIFVMTETEQGGSKAQEDYLNPLVAESTRILLHTVHEAFYERYKDEFGKTIAGFFSDEPGFYNDSNPYAFDALPGKKNIVLPWSPDVPVQLEQALGPDYRLQLPLLWHEEGAIPPAIRYHYMDIVSSLYAQNFSGLIGEWCMERGVEYIGHVLEDNNVHTRLGCGAGHFFRSVWGQTMSGIDVVLWQLTPGFDEVPVKWVAGEADSEFFNYGMGKMASSLAHLDPKKQGRTMAEVFGAYGWAEGLKLMKWLTDHMLVRGVNYYVPHAFSPKEYPDPDCPPHLYARGKNPQFRYYKYLNHYTNRLSHLLSGGTHIATAAVLYHAEAEWSGEFMYFHKPVKELMRRQIDCDVLPVEAILNTVTFKDGKLLSQDESFDCLIIPYSEALPAACLAKLAALAEQGLPVYFVDGLPVRASEGIDVNDSLSRLMSSEYARVVLLDELADRLIEAGFYEIQAEGHHPYLRHYHVRHTDLDVYFYFNEHPHLEVATTLEMPVSGRIARYNAYDNKITEVMELEVDEPVRIPLQLAPFESIVLLSGELEGISDHGPQISSEPTSALLPENWSVSIATSEAYPNFKPYTEIVELTNMSRPDVLPRFSGTFRYETTVEWTSTQREKDVWLDLGHVYETAEVKLNGRSAGVQISSPYRFNISGLLVEGANELIVEVTNTLVKEQRDPFSMSAQQEPSGLLGPVRVIVSH